MAFKDLLVHIGKSRHRDQCIEIAAGMALAFDAHLTGLYTVPDLTKMYASSFVEPLLITDIVASQEAEQARACQVAKSLFNDVTRRAGIKAEWREVKGDAGDAAALHARYVDLTIIGQTDPDEVLTESERMVPVRVLFESGRPVLMVPYVTAPVTFGKRVMIAWNASPQATRAVNDSLPLLEEAKSVTVLAINPHHGSRGHGEVPGADIALHLARHGVKAEATHVFADDVEVGNMILSRAADLEADLIVMGAYGHTRLRELVLGGATRSLLGQMTVPVFMSH
ncbi:MAG TPA: universal stress protein [Alphaproteobacteria bacterium]|nr:universal stress protein [Alphaproteobacteria bacterium]